MQDATKISRGDSCEASEEKELAQQENIAGDRGHFSRSQQCPAPRVDGAWSMPHAYFNPQMVTGRLLLDFFCCSLLHRERDSFGTNFLCGPTRCFYWEGKKKSVNCCLLWRGECWVFPRWKHVPGWTFCSFDLQPSALSLWMRRCFPMVPAWIYSRLCK